MKRQKQQDDTRAIESGQRQHFQAPNSLPFAVTYPFLRSYAGLNIPPVSVRTPVMGSVLHTCFPSLVVPPSLLLLPNIDRVLDTSSPRSGYDSNEMCFGSDEELEDEHEEEFEEELYSEDER